jgi:ClpP class serine protease
MALARGLVRELVEEQMAVKEAQEEVSLVVVRRVQRRLAGQMEVALRPMTWRRLAGQMEVALRLMTWTSSTSRRSRRACDGACATQCT